MKIILIGGSGMLGTDLNHVLIQKQHTVYTPSHNELDITQQKNITDVLEPHK
ncbi:MAG: sugar nucleotide-binding protein, partial [Candidatus Margulisbacteria bacterium]|nr:sugar nucleotide-binding protein [Candidatus Margulisiibacteriota bacterium]